MSSSKSDGWGRDRIIQESLPVLEGLSDMQVTVRQLHYQLVGLGMPNTVQHYKRVVAAMEKARWDGSVSFDAFVDHERDTVGETDWRETSLEDQLEQAKRQIRAWMVAYSKNRWERQPRYVEVWIEKKTLQNIAEEPCHRRAVSLFPCKGYPSLTSLYEASERFLDVQREEPREIVILYAGDHDPSGDDIPRAIQENLARLGVDVTLKRFALTFDQVTEYGLPAAPTKRTDSRSQGWDGHGQVELDAIPPREFRRLIGEAIDAEFDTDIHSAVLADEELEGDEYRDELRAFVAGLED